MTDGSHELDRIFPGLDEISDDALNGMADFTNGKARTYFEGLSEYDRELVQWYALQGTGNAYVMLWYLQGLVEGYAVVDPARSAKRAIKSAHEELDRIGRFAELFSSSDDFFPQINEIKYSVTDDATGELVPIVEQGWHEFPLGSSSVGLETHRELFTEEIIPAIAAAHQFLDDPKAGSEFFDQSEIYRNYLDGKQQTGL